MNRRIKTTAFALALAGMTAAGAVSIAAQGGGPGGRGGHRAFGRGPGFGAQRFGVNLRALGLTDEQRTQVRGIFERHRDEMRAAGQRVAGAFRAQQDAVSAFPADENAIRAAATGLAAAQTEAALLRARVHNEVFQVLTPEQQAKAKELRAAREQRREQRRERLEQRRQQRQQERGQNPAVR